MSNNELKTFVDHLEFLGYEFEKGEDSTYYWGKHEKYGPIWVGKPSEKAPLGLRSFWSLDKTKIDQDKLLYFELTYSPIATGPAVRKNICNPRNKIFRFGDSEPKKNFIEYPITRGKVITVRMLATAVQDIERAVSPLASLVSMLEVTPPGQQASIIIPIAILSDKENVYIIQNATRGRKII